MFVQVMVVDGVCVGRGGEMVIAIGRVVLSNPNKYSCKQVGCGIFQVRTPTPPHPTPITTTMALMSILSGYLQVDLAKILADQGLWGRLHAGYTT